MSSNSYLIDHENAMNDDRGMINNLEKIETVNEQDIKIKLTPGKDIILTIDSAVNGGVTYMRWDKKTCWKGAQLIYQANAAGGYDHKRNNFLCLPKDPQYFKF